MKKLYRFSISILLLTLLLTLFACSNYPTVTKATKSKLSKASTTQLVNFWEGNWYGWWHMTDTTGEYAKSNFGPRDCSGTITLKSNNRAKILLWDKDFTHKQPMAEVNISIKEDGGVSLNGASFSESGHFRGCTVDHANWLIDPGLYGYENFLVIEGSYKDIDGEFSYSIYLRPWGQKWDDVVNGKGIIYGTDGLPPSYKSWYLPMLEKNAPMPNNF